MKKRHALNKAIAIWVITFIMLFILSLILDENASYLTSLIKNPFFDSLFGWLTNFVNIFVLLILATTLLLLDSKKRGWTFPLWFSFFVSFAIASLLKILVARPRPMPYYCANLLIYSFPSIHATVAFALVPILNVQFPSLKWLWFLFALLFAFSRLYLNLHFLSDIVFGALLGYLIGILALQVEEKYKLFKLITKT